MNWQYSPYILPLLFGIVILLILAISTWQHRHTLAGRVFFGFQIALIEWTFCYMMQLSSVTLPAKLFWDKAQFIGVICVPLLWLEFALAYTGRESWISSKAWPALLIPPAITLGMAFTLESHRWWYGSYNLVTSDSYILLDVSQAGWFWVHAAYSYLLLIAGTLVFGRALFRVSGTQRTRIGLVLLSAGVPWLVNMLFVFHLLPTYVDLTSFSFTISSLLVSFSLFSFRSFNPTPVAYNTVIASMDEGLIILDPQNHVVNINPAACQMIGLADPKTAIGQSAEVVLARWADLIERFRHASHASEELVFGEGKTAQYYEMRISTIYNRHSQRIGRLLLLNNITAHVHVKEALQANQSRLSAYTSALLDPTFICDEDGQYIEAIVPKNLPPIPGFHDLRGHYFHEVLPAPTAIQVLAATRKTIQTGQFSKVEYAVNLPGGDLWFEGRITPVHPLPGQKRLALLIAHDITARRQAENSMRRLSAQLNDMLHHYVPRTVDGSTISDPETVHLSGTRREITVLFADLHEFTRWSERHTSEEIFRLLNRQMGIGIRAILAESGTLDKLMGNTLMAAFNVPQEQPDHALRAIRTAQAILAAMPAGEDIPLFSIGIYTGIAVAGNVGNEHVMNYTVLGEAVNQSRHLQEIAEPAQILISQNTYHQVKNNIPEDALCRRSLTEGADELEVYELIPTRLKREARGTM